MTLMAFLQGARNKYTHPRGGANWLRTPGATLPTDSGVPRLSSPAPDIPLHLSRLSPTIILLAN